MWWRRAILAVALAGCLAAAGCGFRPVYGTRSADPGVDNELATIRVNALPNRDGQLIRNALLQRLTPDGEPERPRYQLQMRVSASEVTEAVQPDGTASRDEVIYRVAFDLINGDTKVYTGNFTRMLSYDYLDQHYSNISARQDVQTRAADVIADQVQLELAAYFTRAAARRHPS